MEAQEKAKELVEKLGKEHALIAVEEIEQFMMMDDEYNEDCHMANTHWIQYWQQVKAEIEKM